MAFFFYKSISLSMPIWSPFPRRESLESFNIHRDGNPDVVGALLEYNAKVPIHWLPFLLTWPGDQYNLQQQDSFCPLTWHQYLKLEPKDAQGHTAFDYAKGNRLNRIFFKEQIIFWYFVQDGDQCHEELWPQQGASDKLSIKVRMDLLAFWNSYHEFVFTFLPPGRLQSLLKRRHLECPFLEQLEELLLMTTKKTRETWILKRM